MANNNAYFSSTQTLQSIYSNFTSGSVIFQGTSNFLAQNNANLFWDNTNFRLGIGTNTPTSLLQIVGSAAGNISANIQNTDAVNTNTTSWNTTNDAGNVGSLTIFGSNFLLTYLQNVTRVSGTNALWLVSDVNNQNGGTDNIVFSPGGYNNITAQATNAGLTAINYTDTGIAATNAGAPLSINSSQVIVPGITNTSVTSTTATASSTTAAALLTTTPASGTYLVIYSGNITASSAGGNILTVSIYVGGTQDANSVRTAQPTSTAATAPFQNMTIATNAIVTVNGSQAIAIYGVTSAGTVTTTQREMNLIRVA